MNHITQLILTLSLVFSLQANAAKGPEKAGKLFAQITACTIAGKLNKHQKTSADLNVISHYKIASKGNWWKNKMKKGQKKEFNRLDNTNKIELAIMCGIIKDKWT